METPVKAEYHDYVAPSQWDKDNLGTDHVRLLYLISKYSSETKWIREMPLLVLLYEGVQRASRLVASRRFDSWYWGVFRVREGQSMLVS